MRNYEKYNNKNYHKHCGYFSYFRLFGRRGKYNYSSYFHLHFTGSSSGSGPTIGGVTLKEATYKGGTTSFAFVNSTSANVVISGGTSYCYIFDTTSTTASKLKTNSANTGNATMAGISLSGYDNVTAYYTTMKQGTWTSGPATFHMYMFADNDSSFYSNGIGLSTKAQADAVYVLGSTAYTKQ